MVKFLFDPHIFVKYDKTSKACILDVSPPHTTNKHTRLKNLSENRMKKACI